MSRFSTTLVLLALFPLSVGDAGLSEPLAVPGAHPPASVQKTREKFVETPLRVVQKIVKHPVSVISLRRVRLPDGNIEFCAGPGHQ